MDTGVFFTHHRSATVCIHSRGPFRDKVKILKILQCWVLNGEYSSLSESRGVLRVRGEMLFHPNSGHPVLLRRRHWHQFRNPSRNRTFVC